MPAAALFAFWPAGTGRRRGQAEDGHVAVDGLALARPHLERLVPDADVTRVAHGPAEAPPRLQVRQVPVASGAVEILRCALPAI